MRIPAIADAGSAKTSHTEVVFGSTIRVSYKTPASYPSTPGATWVWIFQFERRRRGGLTRKQAEAPLEACAARFRRSDW
jgi:hypothetical protein